MRAVIFDKALNVFYVSLSFSFHFIIVRNKFLQFPHKNHTLHFQHLYRITCVVVPVSNHLDYDDILTNLVCSGDGISIDLRSRLQLVKDNAVYSDHEKADL